MKRWRYWKGRGPYRSRNGMVLGVCRGIAEHFDFNVFWLRIGVVLLLLLSGLWPVAALYFIAYLLMKPEPVRTIETEEDREFYDSYIHSRRNAAQRMKRRYDHIERRIRRMEDLVTSREFDWERRMRS